LETIAWSDRAVRRYAAHYGIAEVERPRGETFVLGGMMRLMKALIGIVALFVPLLARAEDKDPVELTPQQVAQAITEKNVYVFDNTDSDSFKAAHVPHARLLHPGLYTSKDLPANKNATLIFYCYDKG
jgi:hypothetical protein